MLSKRNIVMVLMGIFCLQLMLAVGCKKPPPPPPPPPPVVKETPPPPPRPSASLSAEPSSIERGKSATLKWSSQNATSASLNQGIGAVPTSGSREVFPTQSTTYELTARGAGGEAGATARVTVRVPPPPPPPPPPTATAGEVLDGSVRDVFFDYDKSDIRSDGESALRSNADGLKKFFNDFTSNRVVVEGHCDERGTNEYNLALGDRRATTARDFLVNLGVPVGKLTTISYGEERPQCTSEDENCWQRNRRAHFSVR